MQLNSEKRLLPIGFLVVLIAYLPVTSFLFAIKNDFFTAYFPLKRYLSVAIHDGIFPLWNPFLNYGFPVYGDISEAWWNPGTWLMAVVGYTPWSFTIEIILYLLLGCYAMYKFSGIWVNSLPFRFAIALSYVCGGFFVSHIQHFNWIAGMACFPLFAYCLIRYIQSGQRHYLAATGISGLWFFTAAHPGHIIGAALFMIPILTSQLNQNSGATSRMFKAAIITLAGIAGMIYGYAEVLPHTNRIGAVTGSITPEGATPIASWAGTLVPLSSVKAPWLHNDPALRNCYFSMLLLIGLIITIIHRRQRDALFFLFLGLFFAILSSEIILPLYKSIPILNHVRLNGEFRIFAIMGFIMSGGISLMKAWNNTESKLVIRIVRSIQGLLLISALSAIATEPKALHIDLGVMGSGTGQIKYILDHLSFAQTILIQFPVQMLICEGILTSWRKKRLVLLCLVCCIDLIVNSSMYLPFTGVGQKSVNEIAEMFSLAPGNAVIPENKAELSVVSAYPNTVRYTGNWALVSGQIAQENLIDYPLVFPQTLEFLKSGNRAFWYAKPPFFLTSGLAIVPERFQFTSILFPAKLPKEDTLLIKQNWYPGWIAELDGKSKKIQMTHEGLMAIPTGTNSNQVRLFFSRPLIGWLLVLEFIYVFTMAMVWLRWRKTSTA